YLLSVCCATTIRLVPMSSPKGWAVSSALLMNSSPINRLSHNESLEGRTVPRVQPVETPIDPLKVTAVERHFLLPSKSQPCRYDAEGNAKTGYHAPFPSTASAPYRASDAARLPSFSLALADSNSFRLLSCPSSYSFKARCRIMAS